MAKKRKDEPVNGFRLLTDKSELVSIERLFLHPRNPNKGNVGRISDSVEVNGFYGALIVQKSTGYILVGNHRYQAAVARGALQLPVFYADVSDDEALRILLADNALGKLAEIDTKAVSSLLEEIDTEIGDIDGTGYSHSEWAEMALKEARSEAKEASRQAGGVEGLESAFALAPARVADSCSKWWKSRRKAWETYLATRPKAERIAAGPDSICPVAVEAAVRWFSPEGGVVCAALGGAVRKFVTEKLGRAYVSAPKCSDLVLAVGPPDGDGLARITEAAAALADDRFMVVFAKRLYDLEPVNEALAGTAKIWELISVNQEVKNADIRPFDVSRQAIGNALYLAVYVKGDPVAAARAVGPVEYGFTD